MAIDFASFMSGSPDQNATVKEARDIETFRVAAGLMIGPIVAIQTNAGMGDAQELTIDQIGGYKGPLYLYMKYSASSSENIGLMRGVIVQCNGDAITAATRLNDELRKDMATSSGVPWDIRVSPVAVEAAGKALAASLPKF